MHIQALPPGLTTPCRVNTAMDSPHRVHFAEQLVETEPDNGTASAAPSRGDGDAAEGAQAAEAAGAAPVNATKADGNLPTCYYLATSGTKTYEGEYQWVIELEKGWSAWLPGNEPFQGSTAKPMRYTLGRYDFEVHFESESHGTQTNLTTGKVRRIQRLQKGEAFPAWEGTGVRRRPASAAAGAPAKNATAAPADSAAKAAQSNRTARRSGYPWPQPQGPTQVTKSQPGRPQVSQAAYKGSTTTPTAPGLPRYMRPLKSKA